MKLLRYISFPIIIGMMMMTSSVLTSCEQDGDGVSIETPDGAPEIEYVRLPNPSASDSLLESAQLGTLIAIVGNNLGGTREIWFNDKPAILTPTWVTNRTILVDIPSVAPDNVTDIMYLVNAGGDTMKYPFVVTIPPPLLESARNEWPQEEENLIINGNYFFEPLTVLFTGDVEGEIVSVTQDRLEVSVPEGAVEGPVTVTTNFGQSISAFHVWDSRNIVLNFDDLMPNGWRTGLQETGDNEISGNYNVYRFELPANHRDEGPSPVSPRAFNYWGGNDPNRFENFYPYYPNSYHDYVLKFEAKVNTWYGGYLNIALAPPDHTNSNQEYWSNDINARAIWGPWAEEDEEFTTDGGWITVTIPLTEFKYFMDLEDNEVVYTPDQKFVETAAGSLSTWLIGSPESDGSLVEFYVDNFRFVPAR